MRFRGLKEEEHKNWVTKEENIWKPQIRSTLRFGVLLEMPSSQKNALRIKQTRPIGGKFSDHIVYIWDLVQSCPDRFHNTENKAATLDDSKSWTTIQKLGEFRISPHSRSVKSKFIAI